MSKANKEIFIRVTAKKITEEKVEFVVACKPEAAKQVAEHYCGYPDISTDNSTVLEVKRDPYSKRSRLEPMGVEEVKQYDTTGVYNVQLASTGTVFCSKDQAPSSAIWSNLADDIDGCEAIQDIDHMLTHANDEDGEHSEDYEDFIDLSEVKFDE